MLIVSFKGGLSNQQVIVRNANNVDVKLYQANGSVIPNTTL